VQFGLHGIVTTLTLCRPAGIDEGVEERNQTTLVPRSERSKNFHDVSATFLFSSDNFNILLRTALSFRPRPSVFLLCTNVSSLLLSGVR
jgi:hypothetical protein